MNISNVAARGLVQANIDQLLNGVKFKFKCFYDGKPCFSYLGSWCVLPGLHTHCRQTTFHGVYCINGRGTVPVPVALSERREQVVGSVQTIPVFGIILFQHDFTENLSSSFLLGLDSVFNFNSCLHFGSEFTVLRDQRKWYNKNIFDAFKWQYDLYLYSPHKQWQVHNYMKCYH